MVPSIVHPIFLIFHVRCLNVKGVSRPIATVQLSTSFPKLRTRVMYLPYTISPPMVLVIYPVTKEDNSRSGSFSFISKGYVCSFNVHFSGIRPIKGPSTFWSFLSFIMSSIPIKICVCITLVNDVDLHSCHTA